MKEKFLKIVFYYFAGGASIIALSFFVYYQFIFKNVPIIDIKEVDVIQLTEIPEVKKLKVSYKYDSINVKNLWKIKYFIRNIGSKNIIGEGNLKTIISNKIPLEISNVSRIFTIDIQNNDFPISIYRSNEKFNLDFKQWKSGEYFEIHGLVETLSNKSPKITINPQEIIDSEVNYSKFELSTPKENAKLIEKLPHKFASFLKWIVVTFILIADIAAIIAIRKELIKSQGDGNLFILKLFSFILWLVATALFSAPLLWLF